MINGKKYVTITTDAGVRDKVGAYAFWIKTDDITIQRSGRFKNEVDGPHEAEMMAILNGLYKAKELRSFYSADIVIINTDSKAAIHAFTAPIDRVKKEYHFLRSQFLVVRKDIKQEIRFKHVKGHSKGKTSREWLNRWCDKELRKHYS